MRRLRLRCTRKNCSRRTYRQKRSLARKRNMAINGSHSGCQLGRARWARRVQRGANSARESSGAKVVASLFLPGSELNIGAAFGELEVCKLGVKTELLRQPLAFTALEVELEVRKIGAIADLLGGF